MLAAESPDDGEANKGCDVPGARRRRNILQAAGDCTIDGAAAGGAGSAGSFGFGLLPFAPVVPLVPVVAIIPLGPFSPQAITTPSVAPTVAPTTVAPQAIAPAVVPNTPGDYERGSPEPSP